MAGRNSRRYTREQKHAILARIEAGERRSAIAKETGIPAVTIGYWLRQSKDGGEPIAEWRRPAPSSASVKPRPTERPSAEETPNSAPSKPLPPPWHIARYGKPIQHLGRRPDCPFCAQPPDPPRSLGEFPW